jgi:hypothetical protein
VRSKKEQKKSKKIGKSEFHQILQTREAQVAKKIRNLNELSIETDSSPIAQFDYSIDVGKIEVYFKNLENILVQKIRSADVILGCVAWLTNYTILDALAETNCSLVIQKEDFLRPDLDPSSGWRQTLRDKYENLNFKYDRHGLPGIAGSLSVASDPSVDPIRCVGNINTDSNPAWPRAHHKFVVFCSAELNDGNPQRYRIIKPHAVWTGSFNFTKNATESFENAVFINDESIATAFAKEYGQIYALSEPLDWSSTWHAPEYRIGT